MVDLFCTSFYLLMLTHLWLFRAPQWRSKLDVIHFKVFQNLSRSKIIQKFHCGVCEYSTMVRFDTIHRLYFAIPCIRLEYSLRFTK